MQHPEVSMLNEITKCANAIELSKFPDRSQLMNLIDQRNRRAIAQAERVSIGEIRNCFVALRSQQDDIETSAVFLPMGITVGELVLSQILFKGGDRVRKM